MEITKEGVSIYYLKEIICINIYIFFPMGFEQNLYIVFLKKSDETWSVDMAEPMGSLQANNVKTVSHILSLVSLARNIETEGPITVISRYIFISIFFLYFLTSFYSFFLFILFQEKCILLYLIFNILLTWNNKFLNRTLILSYKGVFERNTEIRK